MLIQLYRRSSLPERPATEQCFYIDLLRAPILKEMEILKWLIAEPLTVVAEETIFGAASVLEIGPRLSVETPFSSNAVSICRSIGIPARRFEMSTRYSLAEKDAGGIADTHLDPMMQEVYQHTLATFESKLRPEPVYTVPVLERGEDALCEANATLGLGMDDSDIAYYLTLFKRLGRNPTNVELFQIGNANSEHSRHWYFRGMQVIDGVPMRESLMEIVQTPWKKSVSGNSLIAFRDNAGVMRGARTLAFFPKDPGAPSLLRLAPITQHITATAETHNHPTLVAPFPGAETGAGGRIRDNRAVGRGGLVHAGLAGYCVGNLHLPKLLIPGEMPKENVAKSRTALPREILIRGSDGISSYGNKIGEPLIAGFTRSFGLIVHEARREWRKPVLWSGGIGRVRDIHVAKRRPEKEMLIVRIGGPAYRIGVGGGSASSMIHGQQDKELDLKSVQRGNAEMGNRVNRVIQACAEMDDRNPIESIHDQGAGGPSNVLTELMEPAGGRVDIRNIIVGDRTMSVLEIWVAEYQEGYGLLAYPQKLPILEKVCERERVNCEVLGVITGDGSVVVLDSADGTRPVNLSLADILSEMPQKRFASSHLERHLSPLMLPHELSVSEALQSVFLQPQVGSKGFLVRKVDRSVTGLVARQQCCGPTQVPVADAAVTADGYFGIAGNSPFGLTGAATALGEQPIKMMISPSAGARMAVAEMLTNLASVRVTALQDVKCRANWMWAAKRPGEGALLYDAACAMRDIMLKLGIAIDGGKDSLSMATLVEDELVVSPGELVIFGYAPVPDLRKIMTPDFKGGGMVGFVDLGGGRNRLGGSSLAQTFGQIGNDTPDIDDPLLLKRAFEAIQSLIAEGLITAYHDRSDGGLITTLAEMCIAGNHGARIDLPSGIDPLAQLFSEEAGMVFEYLWTNTKKIRDTFLRFRIPSRIGIGTTGADAQDFLSITAGKNVVFRQSVAELRQWWEETSTHLEELQANPATVEAEKASHGETRTPAYHLSFVPKASVTPLTNTDRPKVAILREEGTNGDREMAAAFYLAGCEPWDIAMSDILSGRVETLDEFRGLVPAGGFSYMDVFGSAKGWAAPLLFNSRVREMFSRFYERKDTFSLGICNGCQLFVELGLVPGGKIPESAHPRLVQNLSERFESRWVVAKIQRSPSLLFQGMEGSTFGIWVAHGEGRFLFPDREIAEEIRDKELIPLVYVDPDGEATEKYPWNPNGSPWGAAGLVSPDGRHTVLMPHPERAFLLWQWPWMPPDWRQTLEASPWLRLFQNARDWCTKN